MSDGEEPVAEPTLQSLNADMRAQSSLLRELATAVAQLTARDRVVDGEGAHDSGSGQRFAGQPTGSGGAAERPDLLELAQSGRVGAKSRLQLQVAGVGEDVAADVDVAAKVSTSDGVGRRSSELKEPCEATFRLSQFAEFCHDSENISPLEATTATVVRYVAWIGERGHIAAKSLQPYLSAINTFFELHNLVPIAKDSLHLTSARQSHLDYRALLASVVNFLFFARGLTGVSCRVQDVHVDTYNITLQIYREKGRAGRRGPGDLRVLLLPVSEHPRVARLLHHFIDNVQSVPLVTVGVAASNFWAVNVAEQSKPWTAATMSDWLSTAVNLVNAAPPAGTSWTSHSLRKGAASAANANGAPLSHIRYQGGWATNSDVVLDYIDPNVLPSPGAWFFFGHIAPLRHFQVQQDSAAVAFPVPPS
eukprot:jgi/Tetstr1/428234/TSEL_018274.t1